MLKIHRVKFEDEGRYTCVAINELGHSSCSAYLEVSEVEKVLLINSVFFEIMFVG